MEEPETSIAELFARDPLKLTRGDRDRIVAKYRENRRLFLGGEKQAGATKPKSAKAKALEEVKKAVGKLDISDLL